MKDHIRILAIETSCDETAAAVISNCHSEFPPRQVEGETGASESPGSRNEFGVATPVILSSVVSSQADLHTKTGGVVPEVASRAHMESILPVVEEALAKANDETRITNDEFRKRDLLEGVTHIAVTNCPGLIGSLLVGFNAAKTIAYAKNLPFVPVNHIEGHIYSAIGRESLESNEESQIEFPIIALTVSGGHTSLTLMKDHGEYETLGETIDDAAGEAFDKVAKLLDLGYPGGPAVSKFAAEFRAENTDSNIKFPRPLMDKSNFDFSFSGLKTAVLTLVKKLKNQEIKKLKNEICWAFEEAVVDVLCTKTIRAAKKFQPKAAILAGGVAANRRLRDELKKRLEEINIELKMPEMSLCGDNAAMIGVAAFYHIVNGDIPKDIFSVTVDSNTGL